MRKILTSLIVIGILSSGVFSLSQAFFNDTETSTGNVLSAGAIDLKIGNNSFYNGQASGITSWSLDDLNALRPLVGSYEVRQVCETVRLTRSSLAHDKALIGFCGGPWTVASYMVAGGSSDRVDAKLAAFRRDPWFVALIDRLVVESIEYLVAQAEAGAQAVQIFDSWAGDLIGDQLQEFVLDPISRIVAGVQARVAGLPVIVFARGIGSHQIKAAALPGVNAIGVETELGLDEIDVNVALQGNLDPVALLAGEDVARREALMVCAKIPKERHIFNLGHGIRLGTDPAVVGAVVDAVRRSEA